MVAVAGEEGKRSGDSAGLFEGKAEVDTTLRNVRIKRLRGRPARREARRSRPPADVLSATCRCLRCDKDVMATAIEPKLPAFCRECYGYLALEGHSDPT